MSRNIKARRQRGFVLTQAGQQRLQQRLRDMEVRHGNGKSLSFERIAEFANLDVNTIKRALSGTNRVDRTTLVQLFQGCGLTLESEDFTRPVLACRQDWGDAVFKTGFLGRQQELETLSQWVEPPKGCRTIVIYGMAGIGKTALALEAARQWRDRFECVIWRSLAEPVPPKEFLQDLLAFLAPELRQDAESSFSQKLPALLGCLERQRCLLIFDNVESLFATGERAGEYQADWANYRQLFEKIGATEHRSCLLLTSQVLPREIAATEWQTAPIRSFCLGGLSVGNVSTMLAKCGLETSPENIARLTQQYSGNPLLLSFAFSTIRDVFAGCVGSLVAQDFSVYGDIRDGLAAQLERLSAAERDTLACIATAREPLCLDRLLQSSLLSAGELIEALESLLRRAAIERKENRFSCSPVVREYIAKIAFPEGHIGITATQLATMQHLRYADLAISDATA